MENSKGLKGRKNQQPISVQDPYYQASRKLYWKWFYHKNASEITFTIENVLEMISTIKLDCNYYKNRLEMIFTMKLHSKGFIL